MSVRFGDVVWVKPPEGLRCVLPAAAGRIRTEVPREGIAVTVDLMVLKLIGHGDLVVSEPAAAAKRVKE